MITCKMVSDDVLEVEERLLYFDRTEISYVYYNLKTRLRSVLGRKDEVPSEPVTDKDWEWVCKYYLPKVEGVCN